MSNTNFPKFTAVQNQNKTNEETLRTKSTLRSRIIKTIAIACLLTISCGFLATGQATGGMAKNSQEMAEINSYYSKKVNKSNPESGLYPVTVFIPKSVELPNSLTLNLRIARNYDRKNIALAIGQAISDSGKVCNSERNIADIKERHCANLVLESDLEFICTTKNSCGLVLIQEANTLTNGENITVSVARLN
jgi:hypothetical protein